VADLSISAAARSAPAHGVSFAEALRVWLRVAALSFGGPAGQIAVMHRIIVDEKKWVGEARFLHALSYCMLLPGPEAHQLAIYIGWLMHRWPGAIVAGGLFVLPGVFSIMALSYIYAAFGNVPAVAAFFFGLKAAVLAIVLQAVQRVGSRALKSQAMLLLAGLAFIGIFFLAVPFPLIVLAAGVIGFVGARTGSGSFQVGPAAKRTAPARACLARNCPSMRGRQQRLLCAFRQSGFRCGWCPCLRSLALSASITPLAKLAASSRKWPLSRLAALTPSLPTWRSRQSSTTGGYGRAKCSMGSAWPRRRRDR
jgi:chromate transport protein ChrA